MVNVFVSCPTWVSKEFEKGRDNFLSFLETFGFSPKTIGSNVYPIECPLDAVIETMKDCQGAIILGYPQIKVDKGYLKDKSINSLLLPTEWNHIEASLAYSIGLPLLIIHHKGVERGIFEPGVTSKFIYKIDLMEADWFLSKNIKGALLTWKNAIISNKKKKTPMSVPREKYENSTDLGINSSILEKKQKSREKIENPVIKIVIRFNGLLDRLDKSIYNKDSSIAYEYYKEYCELLEKAISLSSDPELKSLNNNKQNFEYTWYEDCIKAMKLLRNYVYRSQTILEHM